jgi:CheY-like chemotaxis protein
MPFTNKFFEAKKYYFADTSFKLLMQKRIYQVMILCSNYDYFILEEDGRIDEQIFNEYVSLNLRYPPQFIHATSAEKAFEILNQGKIDLVINMLSVGDMDPFELSEKIKQNYPAIPIVVLTPFSREVSIKLSKTNLSVIDYVFCWLGNTDILLAIIKLIEDKMNVDHDVNEIGVQTILLVEDSIRYYSSYLPNLYKIIFVQSKEYTTEGLNEHLKMLRMRGRPKVLLATSYEEAIEIYSKYQRSILGIITDISYSRNGEKDPLAGIKLYEHVRNNDEYLPILLQSSDLSNRVYADYLGTAFIHKYSKNLSQELKKYVVESLSFGDFVVLNPITRTELFRITDLKSLQNKIFEIPDSSLEYHINRNDLSKWLYSRSLFSIAELLKYVRKDDFKSLDELRRYVFETIAGYRMNKGRGVIAEFDRNKFDEYLIFSRVGNGSIGGKARGLAFIDSLIKRNWVFDNFNNVIISIPRTVVLSTDVFDEFMESNDLYPMALSNATDEEILLAFVEARLPFRIHEDLYAFICIVKNPIAIRSSSLLEDSHYQPFAGIYSTYMIPRIDSDILMIEKLSDSIKSVYASVFFKASKAYMSATHNVIDEEKMGIVLQEVCGSKHGDRFYPTFSGVARSINFYPIAPEKPSDGIASVALGLGKYIVEGGVSLRFSPKYPKKIIQLSSVDMAIRETQKSFLAIDLNETECVASVDDGFNLKRLDISDAEEDGTLTSIASTYDYANNILRDGTFYDGKRIITFSNILNFNTFPLAEVLASILEIGQKEMNNPVEIEFAVDIRTGKGEASIFNLLQIRPIVDNKEIVEIEPEEFNSEQLLLMSKSALGNGVIDFVRDVVYVKPESFDASKNNEVAKIIEHINDGFIKSDSNYILIGPGRWGSSDSWLGIPVKWTQISHARLIIESGLDNYRVDPSQGTHFFQNLTSFRVGYFTINPYIKDGIYDINFLNSLSPIYEDKYIRHVRFENPLRIKIDGKKSIGIVLRT